MRVSVFDRDGIIGRELVGGTDRVRSTYDRSRRTLRLRDTVRRVRAARALGPSRYTIPQDRGYLVVPDTASFGSHIESVMSQAEDALRELQSGAVRSTSGKEQLRSGLVDQHLLDLSSPLLRFALSAHIVSAVSEYLGEVPVLERADVWHSVNTPTSSLSGSQLFHCDWESVRKVRVFVMCSDVHEECGPLTVLPADESSRVRAHIGYRYLPSPAGKLMGKSDASLRLSDAQVYSATDTPPEPIVGRRGSVAFVDTSRCLHYGSRVRSGQTRLLASLQFLPSSSFALGRMGRRRPPFRHLVTAGTTATPALVLGA